MNNELSKLIREKITWDIEFGVRYRTFQGDIEVVLGKGELETKHPNIYNLAFATPLFVKNGIEEKWQEMIPQVVKNNWRKADGGLTNICFFADVIDYLKCHHNWTPTQVADWMETIEARTVEEKVEA